MINDMKRMQVKDIMITNIISVKETMPAPHVAALIAQHHIHAIPVMNEAYALVGIIAEGDFFYKETASLSVTNYISTKKKSGLRSFFGGKKEASIEELTAKDMMTSPSLTVDQEADIIEAAKIFVEKGINTLPVISHEGTLVGVITSHDILKTFVEAKG